MAVNNNHTKTRVEAIGRKNKVFKDVYYPEIDFELLFF